jgi:NTE family protein
VAAALRIVAVDALRGERVALDSASGVPVARAVAALRAIPALLPPVTFGGLTCIDGALGSATNADLVSSRDTPLVIVITATPADPPASGPDRLWLAALGEEVDELERAGHHVALVQAGEADLAAMGPDPISAVGAPSAVIAGRARGHALVDSGLLDRAA